MDRNRQFTEYYEADIDHVKAKQAACDDREEQLSHLIEKTKVFALRYGHGEEV